MRFAGTPALVESCSGESCGGGAVVVVGVKLDSRSRELLTWALVKVAQTGDRVIALHVLDQNTDKTGLISLVQTFDSVLAAYEGFCNLKQVDLKLKVCRGSPVRKILSREAQLSGATSLIVGTSEVHHTILSRISVAKYCAKNLQKNVSVVCADNGKIVFLRESTAPTVLEFSSCDVSESRSKRRRTTPKSPLNLPPNGVLSSSSSKNVGISMALVPIKTTHRVFEYSSRWALLRKIFPHTQRIPEASSKNSSILRWMSKLPSRQSVAAIYPDQKQSTSSCTNDCSLEMDQEKGSIVVSDGTRSVAYSSKIFLELNGLGKKYFTICQSFSFQELTVATNNFAPENLIGKGGSSVVYRGCLQGGKELAVKILKPSDDAFEQFASEIDIITSLRHQNIISLVGFCFEDDNKLLLVYDLLPRGSLEDNLHGTQKFGKLFGWEERYKVALGVAEALDYLHNMAEPIIHRDVKSSNILLSNDFEPQLADFGLATWASRCSHHIGASDVTGTFGYLAPEYFMHGKLDTKIDVYAFGVVLLELLSGRKPIDNERPTGHESLVIWARHILQKGDISELQDPNLASDYDNDQFEKIVSAATLCIRDTPHSRPEINLVLKLLQGSPEVIEWARKEIINSSEEENGIPCGPSPTNIQSFLNLALLNLDNESDSISSTEKNISVEDYLAGRWSRSTSFD